ncbi:microtubule-associated protein 9 isoform X2 [Paramisgurnus dabryanus]|uniref:microtubule-associated protein 9 isoform X2 n=1 Tax=Paramisgurnus dabryanus TaxID=90735 RepID=UPI0031F34336
MMDDDHFSTTLAYTKSPKTSRRTTFQNELEAAVSARTNRHKPRYSYSDDFDDDEDHDKDDDGDILSNLLKTQKEKKDRFRAGRTKGKISDFMLLDDEDENVKPKKLSFLKTKVKSSPVHIEQQDSMKSAGNHHGSFHFTPQNPQNSVTTEKNQEAGSPFCSQSDNLQPQSTLQKADRSESVMRMRNQTESSMVRKSLSESPLPFSSEYSQWKSSVPLPSEGSLCDSPVSLVSDKQDNQRISFGKDCDLPIPHPRERSVKTKLPSGQGCPAEDMSPRPLPRHKTVNDHGPLEEKTQAETTDCSVRATSTMSIVLSNTSTTNDSVQGPDEGRLMSQKSKTYSSSTSENISEAPAIAGSVASEESKEEIQSTSFEEKHERSHGNFGNHTFTLPAQKISKSSGRKSKSSYTAESKYLGTLKILDQRTQEAQQIPEAADSLRAAVYQEWVKKKEEKIKIKMMAKKQEEKLKEDKKQEDMLAKIADAKASYEAWKEKKVDVIRKKEKEKQEAVNRQQMEMDKIQEKKETAKQVFEKWKQEHDEILKEKIRKKKQTEKREKLQQGRVKDERNRECTSAFVKWSEQKKCVIQAKVREERKQETFQEVEEQYEKEEREKMALEVYDKWLRRKEFQQKRERKEKRIQAILHDDPLPPWSPPNKTIPFGK